MEHQPNTRWLTWLLIALLLGGAAAAYVALSGCASNPSWPAIQQEVAYLYLDVQDAQALVEDPKTKEHLADAAEALSKISIALDAYIASADPGNQQGLVESIQGAIAVVEAIWSEDLPEEAKVALFMLKSSLRRWAGYAGAPAS